MSSAGFWQVPGPLPCPSPDSKGGRAPTRGRTAGPCGSGTERDLPPASLRGRGLAGRAAMGSRQPRPGPAVCWGCVTMCSAGTSGCVPRCPCPACPARPRLQRELPLHSPALAGMGSGSAAEAPPQQTGSPGTGETGGTPGRAWALSHCVRREGHGTGHAGDGRGRAQPRLRGAERGRREPRSTPRLSSLQAGGHGKVREEKEKEKPHEPYPLPWVHTGCLSPIPNGMWRALLWPHLQ